MGDGRYLWHQNHMVLAWNLANGQEMGYINDYSGLKLVKDSFGETRFGSLNKIIQAFPQQEMLTGWLSSTWYGGPYAISLDCQRAVVAGYMGTIKVWNLENDMGEMTLQGHNLWIHALAMSADGRHFVSGSVDRTVKFWDTDSGKIIHTVSGHEGEVLAVAISSDGKMAVSASRDQTLKVWNVNEGKELVTLQEHSGMVFSAAISQNAHWVLSGGEDRTVKLWQIQKEMDTFREEYLGSTVSALAISKNGRFLITGAINGNLKVWNLDHRKIYREFDAHTTRVSAVAINADGKYALSAENDGTLKLWNLKIGKQLRILQNPQGRRNNNLPKKEKDQVKYHSANLHSNAIPHESVFRIITLIMSDNGRQALGSDGRTMKLWDIESGQEQTLTLPSSLEWIVIR